jgi:hypothetical protein
MQGVKTSYDDKIHIFLIKSVEKERKNAVLLMLIDRYQYQNY